MVAFIDFLKILLCTETTTNLKKLRDLYGSSD